MNGGAGDPRGRLGIALLAGALLGTLLEVALLMLGDGLGRLRALAPDEQALLRFVFGGGWFAFPVAGAGVGAAVAAAFSAGAARARAVVAAAGLLALPFALRPAIRTFEDARPPRGERATVLALTRWTFRSPRTLARVLPYAAARDPVVREQAMLALGENLVVDDFEHATAGRPPRDPAPRLRARMRDTLLAALARDPAEG
ncbi:MAG TPA: hypothetical protein VGU27_05735, partial [Candidatus Eisenbacteria bacterium]|nr:hypothetical protein [Candidatus Eisenbacteria bacterium]